MHKLSPLKKSLINKWLGDDVDFFNMYLHCYGAFWVGGGAFWCDKFVINLYFFDNSL